MSKAKESKFQAKLIKKLQAMFPGCIVVKNDPNYIQGIPDLLVLYNDTWAALECKRSSTATHRPNQDYYVAKMKEMSYAAFIYPENEEEILNELQQTFKPCRITRVPKCKRLPLAERRPRQTKKQVS